MTQMYPPPPPPLYPLQNHFEVAAKARASTWWMPTWHVPASQLGQHLISNRQNEWKRRVEKSERSAGIWKIVPRRKGNNYGQIM